MLSHWIATNKAEKYLTEDDLMTLQTLRKALDTYETTVSCVGLYNHGKSTLLNILVKDFDFNTFKVADKRETIRAKEVKVGDIKYVDTPGLNANEEDDKVVIEAIKKSDINLFVHTITTGELTQAEVDFLQRIHNLWENPREFISRTIFVLTRIDKINNIEDIQRTASKVKQQIKEIFNSNALIIPVSAMDYKIGISDNEDELVKESNIEELILHILQLIESSKEEITATKCKRLLKHIEKLEKKLQEQIKKRQEQINKIEEEQKNKQIQLQKDIQRIESILESKYAKLEE